MELKDFIENTIINIAEGVYKAGKGNYDKFYILDNCTRDVNFDLMIQEEETNSEDNTKSKSGSIKVLKVLNAGIDGEENSSSSNKNTSSNRVQFSVPIQYRGNFE